VKKYCVTVWRVTAAEHHVLLCVRRAGKVRRGLVRSSQVVDLGRDDGRERVAHDYHAQAVAERGAQRLGAGGGEGQSEKEQCDERAHEAGS
jgi:hypothetical protein